MNPQFSYATMQVWISIITVRESSFSTVQIFLTRMKCLKTSGEPHQWGRRNSYRESFRSRLRSTTMEMEILLVRVLY